MIGAAVLLFASTAVIDAAETHVAPSLVAAGLSPSQNMEGKEVRSGAAWAGLSTGASSGPVNAMHGGFMTPAEAWPCS